MRKLATIFVSMVFLLLATPVAADVEELITGVNGMVTAPLDPVFALIDGLADGDRLVDLGPANAVTDLVQAAVVGVKDGVMRFALGAGDAVTFLVTEAVGGPWSPEARLDLTDMVRDLLGQIPGLGDAIDPPTETPTE